MKSKFILIVLTLMVFSCDKSLDDTSCFNSELVHNNFCTTDCPGFIGCDDKTYCNECEAARVGIGPK